MNVTKLAAALAVIMMMTVVAAPAISAEDSVDLTATVLEPKPEIGIELSTNALNFGSLYPGNTSAPQDLTVTNIGLKEIDVTATASDDGQEPLFLPGLLIDEASWSVYLATLAADEFDNSQLALHVPDDFASRGAVSGGATFWAEEHSNLPEADFSADVTSGVAPLTVQFTDMSTNSPTSWAWDFGDGTTSTEQNPSHTFNEVGTYTVSLTSSNAQGSDTETKSAYVSATVKLNVYSTAGENTNAGAPDPAISKSSPMFVAWASEVIDYSPSPQYIQPEFADPSLALGPATGSVYDIASLGDLTQEMIDTGVAPGSITLGFDVAISNGIGPDFAAFENGFISGGGLFGELGYVEVSTDGVTFARFPSISLTFAQTGGYGTIDSTNLYNLVGKHIAGMGTPFDLSDLAQTTEVLNGSVDLNNINYVRVVDIPGNGSFLDSQGHPIYDAWLTWGSGGLDLEAVGVINVPYVTNYAYTSDGSSVTITGYSGAGGNVIIPSLIDGLPVTTIGTSAFNGRTNITSVTIPAGVTTIAKNAFRGCTGLTSVTIPNSVTSIGDYVFSGCTALTLVTIPSSVTTIGNSMFSGCTALTLVTIPSSVTTIGNSMFSGCTALTSVTMPASVTTIGSNVFNGCTALTAINVDAGNSAFASVDGVLYNKNITQLLQCPAGKTGSITIPSGVTAISGSAFFGCIGLTSVTIPNSVTSIGNGAFSGCTTLISVTMPNSIVSLPVSVFRGCSALTSITIPNSVISIGNYAFYQCAALTSVVIPDSVTSVGSNLFFGCSQLTSATVGSGVTSIGDQTYQDCTALTSVTIGSGVISIGMQAFDGCISLTSITIPGSVTTISDSAFLDCTALTSITIPASVTTISDNAFSGCTALTAINVDAGNSAFASVDGVLYNKALTILKLCPPGRAGSLVIPSSVTNIGGSAFKGCSALTSITMPDSITSIGDMMFYGCSALTSVTIGSGVTSIGMWAFYGCSALTSMAFNGNAPTVSFAWADGIPSTMVVYYHSGALGFGATWNGFSCVELTP